MSKMFLLRMLVLVTTILFCYTIRIVDASDIATSSTTTRRRNDASIRNSSTIKHAIPHVLSNIVDITEKHDQLPCGYSTDTTGISRILQPKNLVDPSNLAREIQADNGANDRNRTDIYNRCYNCTSENVYSIFCYSFATLINENQDEFWIRVEDDDRCRKSCCKNTIDNSICCRYDRTPFPSAVPHPTPISVPVDLTVQPAEPVISDTSNEEINKNPEVKPINSIFNTTPGAVVEPTASSSSSFPSSISTVVVVGFVIGIVLGIMVVLVIGFFVVRKNITKNHSNNDTTNTTKNTNKKLTNTISIENNSIMIDAAAETTSATTTRTKNDGIVLSTKKNSTSILPNTATTNVNDIVTARTNDLTQNDPVNNNVAYILPNALTNNIQQLDDDNDNDTVSGITGDFVSNACGYIDPTTGRRTTPSNYNRTDIPIVTGSIVSDSSSTMTG